MIIIKLLLYYSIFNSNFSIENNNDTIEVKATYYRTDFGEYTADGSRIIPELVLSKEYRWVALSRDLSIEFGDTIEVISTICPKLNGKWVVKDRMSNSKKNMIDFLLHPNELDSINFLYPHKVLLIKKSQK